MSQAIPPSLDEMSRSVTLPAGWLRRLFAFIGPAYMVSVGYMDPGNWATDIEGGSRFGYTLIWVLLMANVMAILLQTLSARLGLVTGRDLAQACRDEYGGFVRYVLFALCEIAIAACDLAEVLGSAIGLNLLLGVPVLWGVLITGADVLVLLAMQRFGIRKMEGLIVSLIVIIGACFVVELFLSGPEWGRVAGGFVPRPLSGEQLYVAIGILGATVMPHNLYLHSALVQSRDVSRSRGGVAQALRFNLVDSIIALNGAFLINGAILVVAAATFYQHGLAVTRLQEAPQLLEKLLGSSLAPAAFALALLCAGQSSTVTGTLAGQITMEGFLNIRMRAWLRRLVTRLLAIGPAVAVILWADKGASGDAAGQAAQQHAIYRLLIFSQVVLSLQLSFAVVPLVKFTASKLKMGPFVSPRWLTILAWIVAAVIAALNIQLVSSQLLDWIAEAGAYGWAVAAATVPIAAGLLGLLAWMALRPERSAQPVQWVRAEEIVRRAGVSQKQFARIGVALEAQPSDALMLGEAIALAKIHRAELILMHVVEGVGGQWYGPQTGDYESRQDEQYVEQLARHLRQELAEAGVTVRPLLGYGDVPRALKKMALEQRVELMVVGGHGHKRFADIVHGETINTLRHGLKIPILAIRK